jgi:hypothetical protein
VNRDSLRPVVIALLAVLAISMAAATLNSPVTESGIDRDPGASGDEVGDDEWQPFSLNLSSEDDNATAGGGPGAMLGLCIQILRRPIVIAGMLGLVLLGTYPVYRKAGIYGSISLLLAVLPFGTIVYAFLTKCRRPPPSRANFGFDFGQANDSGGVQNATGAGPGTGAEGFDPPVVLLVLGAMVVLVLAIAFVRSTGDDALPEEQESEDDPDEAALAAIGEAAGDAADRLAGETAMENEVYRAWREMTDHLDVPNPQSSTPGEFARAATEAGMDRAHVEALTDLFREVRYGGAEPTAEREERAVEALRRIEDAYAGDDR